MLNQRLLMSHLILTVIYVLLSQPLVYHTLIILKHFVSLKIFNATSKILHANALLLKVFN